MSFDEQELGELLRRLPPAPERLVEQAKELPLHFGDEPDADAGGGDQDDADAPRYDDDPTLPPPDYDPGGDAFDDDDPPDGEWG